jgi:hypothetical protein
MTEIIFMPRRAGKTTLWKQHLKETGSPMNSLYIEAGQEKVQLLRSLDSVGKGDVCKVTSLREDNRGLLWVDIESSSGLTFTDLLIGHDCEFTELPMNYPGGYGKMLVY